MIRLLFYLLVFALGLAVAILWFGEMRHLRQALPGKLPIWTVPIDDRATLRNGKAELNLPGTPELVARWAAKAPDGNGLNWDLSVIGGGISLRADLSVPPWPLLAKIRNGQGTIALESLTNGQSRGNISITEISGEVQILPRVADNQGYVDITFGDTAEIPDSVINMLARIGTQNGQTIRIPLGLR